MTMPKIVVVGAGIGGLTTAALLAKAGLDVTVLEAHVYAGGCAGTFFHKGYRFDAGATLAGGFYPGGPMDVVARAVGVSSWPSHGTNRAMVAHLRDGTQITRYGDEQRWQERAARFGPSSLNFWRWQEATADALWALALRTPSWPPQSPHEALTLVGDGLGWLGEAFPRHLSPTLALDALRPVAAHLRNTSPQLRQFIDGQLLIAAQTTSADANALYGASALDLPRRGVVHLEGGIGAIAARLVDAVRASGGVVHFRQEVTRVISKNGRPVAVETKRGERFAADRLVINLPPWNIAKLMGTDAPRKLKQLPPMPKDGWGAFMTYVGFDADLVDTEAPLHHQVIVDEPLGEGNSVFLSLSPAWDTSRAPTDRRALTLSTHTRLAPWWKLYNDDRAEYDRRKQVYSESLLTAAERALPGLRAAAELTLPGTPVTFNRFTRRTWGWVGGFPQTSLFRAWGPKLAPDLWMVGDSIFPGQSTAAVALGGLRVGDSILREFGARAAIVDAEENPEAWAAR